MNIFHKVTLQSLKRSKTRTVVTVIGIILSAAMICAVTTFASSLQNYALRNAIYTDGDWHGSVQDTGRQTLDTIASREEVDSTVYCQQLGYAVAAGCQNLYKPYLYLIGAGEGFAQCLPIHITQGSFPASQDEILLPEHLAENGGLTYRLGDTLTLDIGQRLWDGYPMGQHNPCYTYGENGQEMLNNETIAVTRTQTYTVVGFYERPTFEEYSAPGYTCITLADAAPAADAVYDVYFKMTDPDALYDFMTENELAGDTNSDVLMLLGTSRYSSFHTVLYSLAAIVIGLIIFGSVSLIYNAFSISVSERTKQFGLLSSIGATKKQLRRMVLFEALAVSAVGIPIGVGAGVAGIAVTLLIIGNKFSSALGGVFSVPMRVCVSPASICIACAVALLTVLISAWIPSKRATKVTAVEAIRQNADIRFRGRQVKTSKLIYKLFGLPGVLASKHYKRSRKKYRATVVSLFMSIVLFVSASTFTDYLMESAGGSLSTGKYDLLYYCDEEDFSELTPDALLEKLSDDDAITGAAYTKNLSIRGSTEQSSLNSYLSENTDALGLQQEDLAEDRASIRISVSFVNDAQFKALLAQHGLSEKEYMDPDAPLAVAVDGLTFFDYSQEKYISLKVLTEPQCQVDAQMEKYIPGYSCEGIPEDNSCVLRYVNLEDSTDVLDIPLEEAYDSYSFRCGTTIYDQPFYTTYSGTVQFIYPQSLMDAVLGQRAALFTAMTYYFTSSDHAASEAAIEQTLRNNGFTTSAIYNYAAAVEQSRNLVTIITVFSYGFIVLISLIAGANVFNTISTNIGLRRREFAMLKSVGMSARGFNAMMNYECLLYGTKALLYGLPVSVGVTYLIYAAVSAGYATDFRLPWTAMGIAALSVFAVVFATMLYAMGKVKKDNPIDALKNENL